MENPLPVVGCAAPYEDLRDLRPWLLEKQRDLELQNPSQPEFLDGEWSSIVAEIRSLLDGYTGRLGIHGPFRGMTIDAADPLIASAVITRLRQGIEFGQAIGATQMVMHSPFLFFGKGHLPHSPEHGLAREIDAVRSLIDQPLKEAQAAGITLVVENIFDINPRAVNTLVREINHPCLRRSIDTGHAHLTHQRGGPTADAWVSATGAPGGTSPTTTANSTATGTPAKATSTGSPSGAPSPSSNKSPASSWRSSAVASSKPPSGSAPKATAPSRWSTF
ncbi:MAG: TIM barrel protein [Verrucomicrobiota bacterium]